jgi:hypothetical protein
LQQLADKSGGQLLIAPTPEALVGLYQNIGSILRHQYILTMDVSHLEAGADLPLQIKVMAGEVSGMAETRLVTWGLASPQPTTAPPVVTPGPVVTEEPVSLPVEEEGGASLAPLFVALAAGGLATTGMTGYYFWRRQKRSDPAETDVEPVRRSPPSSSPLFPAIQATVHAEPEAYLQVRLGDESQTFPLGDWPLTIGSTSDCGLRLPEASLTASERVRIWRREGRFMLHSLSRMGVVLIGGKPVTWAILEDGDEVQLGQARLLFRERSDTARDVTAAQA